MDAQVTPHHLTTASNPHAASATLLNLRRNNFFPAFSPYANVETSVIMLDLPGPLSSSLVTFLLESVNFLKADDVPAVASLIRSAVHESLSFTPRRLTPLCIHDSVAEGDTA